MIQGIATEQKGKTYMWFLFAQKLIWCNVRKTLSGNDDHCGLWWWGSDLYTHNTVNLIGQDNSQIKPRWDRVSIILETGFNIQIMHADLEKYFRFIKCTKWFW